MTNSILGGQTTYGHIVGILMSESTIPRIPSDPGHAETFPFPVIYEPLNGFPFEDLISLKKDNIEILIDRAKALQKKGVSLIATNCGLFAPFQSELKKHLDVPFIGSALDIIPFRSDIQKSLRVPVYDLVTLIDFFISGFANRKFQSRFSC